jgi:hypothetical protein
MSFDFKIVNGDFVIKDGTLAIVENTEKLNQDCLKMAITPLGVNKSFRWYGCAINKTLIGNVLDPEMTDSIATSQLQSSLLNLQKLQQEQATKQRVSSSELIAAIKNVSIKQNQVDPRYYSIIISILSRALTESTLEFSVSPI